jgi:threonylcarbamoyladenosine tRNA methylthiotransferase MtaB
MTYRIHTLGCKVNQYESEVMAEMLEAAGILPAPKGTVADICLLNTCAVTAESERKARQIIRRLVKENPGCYLLVTGCYAQLRPEEIASLEGVSYVCGNRAKYTAAEAALQFAKTGKRTILTSAEALDGAQFEPALIRRSERTRAYVKIEDGCDSHCAYCTIKEARGPIRSRSLADTHQEVEALTERGYREVVLTGIEISGWGKDSGEGDLADLLLSLSDIKGLSRIRLGSLDPSLLTPPFIRKLAQSPLLAPHFHLSLQSGCDKTLAAMRRRYNSSMVAQNVHYLREIFPNACLTADTIVGFPGESEEDFQSSAQFIDSLDLLFNHIFPFSRRPNTEADQMPNQISESEKAKRLHQLEEIRDSSTERVCRRFLEQKVEVLWEEYKAGTVIGHTANFLEIACPAVVDLRGKFSTVWIQSFQDGHLIGKILEIFSI